MAKLLDQFVCVRVVQCWGMDLSLFQFDPELTWAVVFLNADKVIYGRYGSRSSHDADEDVSIEGFKAAARGALDLHGQRAFLKEVLAKNRGPQPPWRTPEQIPLLPGKRIQADGSRAGCIHCHMINTGMIRTLRSRRKPIPDELLWPYPMPETVGMKLDVKKAATLVGVTPDSLADKAGLKAGDEILRVDSVPVNSIADVQWHLHRAKAPAVLQVQVKRNGQKVALNLKLPAHWRRAADFGWRSHSWTLRFQLAGFKSTPATPRERERLGLPNDRMALKIERLAPGFARFRNKAAAQVGLRPGDVIVRVDDRTDLGRECDFLAYLAQHTLPGQTVNLEIVRGERSRTVRLPIP